MKSKPVTSVATTQPTLDGDRLVVKQSVVCSKHGAARGNVQRCQTAKSRVGRRQRFLDYVSHTVVRHSHNARHCSVERQSNNQQSITSNAAVGTRVGLVEGSQIFFTHGGPICVCVGHVDKNFYFQDKNNKRNVCFADNIGKMETNVNSDCVR